MKNRYVVDHRHEHGSFDHIAECFYSARDAAVSWAEYLYNHVLTDDAMLRDELIRALDSREFETMEARVACQDGSVVDVDLAMIPMLDWTAEPDQSVIVWRARAGKEVKTDVKCVFEHYDGDREYPSGFYVNHMPCSGIGCKECGGVQPGHVTETT